MIKQILLIRCFAVVITGLGLLLATTSGAANSAPCSDELAKYNNLNSELKEMATQLKTEQNKLFDSQGKQKPGEQRSSRTKKLTREVKHLFKEYDDKLKIEKESYAIYKSCIESHNAGLRHKRQ